MTRRAYYPQWQIALAQELVDSAKRVQQLRQGLAVLIPVLTGASITTTAQVLGLRKSSVFLLRRKLRESGREVLADRERRGGRRRELMSDTDELEFLQSLRALAASQGGLRMSVMHAALEAGRQAGAALHRLPAADSARVACRADQAMHVARVAGRRIGRA